MNKITKTGIAVGVCLLAATITVRDTVRQSALVKQSTITPSQFLSVQENPSERQMGPIKKGGIISLADLKAWVLTHKALYGNFDVNTAERMYAQNDFFAYVQYRDLTDGQVHWTHRLTYIFKGEAIWRDAAGNMIRGRCGNYMSLIAPPEVENEQFADTLTDSPDSGDLDVLFVATPIVPVIPETPPIEVPPVMGPIVFIPTGGIIVDEPIHTDEPSAVSYLAAVLLMLTLYVWFIKIGKDDDDQRPA